VQNDVRILREKLWFNHLIVYCSQDCSQFGIYSLTGCSPSHKNRCKNRSFENKKNAREETKFTIECKEGANAGCGQSLATNALKRLTHQSEQRILQKLTNQRMLQSICSAVPVQLKTTNSLLRFKKSVF